MGAQLLAKQQPSSASVVSLIFLTYKSDSGPQGFIPLLRGCKACSQVFSETLHHASGEGSTPRLSPMVLGRKKTLTAFHQLSLETSSSQFPTLHILPLQPSGTLMLGERLRVSKQVLTMSFASHGEGFISLFGTWEHLALTVLFLACLGDPVPTGTVPPNSRSCHCPIRTYHIKSERSTSIYQCWHLCARRFPLKVRKTSLLPPKVDQKFQRMNSPYKWPSASE